MATTSRQPRRRNGELEPILASWLKDRDELRDVVVNNTVYHGHTALRHIVWIPLYLLRMARYAPWGLWHLLKLYWIWMFDLKTKQLITDTYEKKDHTKYQQLIKQRNQTVQTRVLGTFVGAPCITLFGIGILWLLIWTEVIPAPTTWFVWMVCVIAIVGLGLVGWRETRRVRPDLVADDGTDITGTMVIDALCSLGITGMGTKEQEDVRLLYPVKPSRTVGYDIDIELPKGVPAVEVMNRRGRLSSALRRAKGTVWPSVGPRHEGHLHLFIAHQDISKARQNPWPLLDGTTTNVFKPIPMFTNQRGEWIDLTFIPSNGITGAMPRMGKTQYLRSKGLAAALDSRVEQYVVNLKGTKDLSALALTAHYYSNDLSPEGILEQLGMMRGLLDELAHRAKVMDSLSTRRNVNNEVTDELASDRSLGLHPIQVIVDECQVWFQHEEKEIREEFERIFTHLVKRGPAFGIMCEFATQEFDGDSVPKHISKNCPVRLCFRVMDQHANDQILGSGASATGLKATLFDETDKGIAYLKGSGDPQVVRTVSGLDNRVSEKIATFARAERQRLDLLTGMAAGKAMMREVEQVILIDDACQVMGGAPAMHLGALAAGLVELRPVEYSGLTARKLGSELRKAGVKGDFENARIDGTNGKSVRREQLDVSVTAVIGDDDDPDAVTEAVTDDDDS